MRAKGTLANNLLQSRVDVKRPRGRPARQCLDNVKEWTGLSSKQISREPDDLEKVYQSMGVESHAVVS